jgi:hypothetical protein
MCRDWDAPDRGRRIRPGRQFSAVFSTTATGPSQGIILFRSPLFDPGSPEAQILEPLCVRGGEMALVAALLLIG